MSQPFRLIRSASAAFTWSDEGLCHGVSLVRTSSGCRVAGFWHSQVEAKTASVAGALAQGRRELKLSDGVYLLAGPSGGGWGMSDISVPRLMGEELRSALSFELRKCTPLPQEFVTWGYRVLPTENGAQGPIKVRLVYMKSENWRRWVEMATGLGSVDAILPPPAALDSLLTGTDVMVPAREAFRYVSVDGGREMLPCVAEGMQGLRELLPLASLDLGTLEELPVQEQAAYLPALLLALYGMGNDFAKDTHTIPAIPHELRPRRFFAFKFIAGLLGAVIVIMLLLGIVRAAQLRAARLRIIRADISTVEKEIAACSAKSAAGKKNALKQLETEIGRYSFKTPELPEVLAELTRLIPHPAWMSGAFEWNLDMNSQVAPVTFVIREPSGTTANLAMALNLSPLLGDASESRSTGNQRKFVLKARYDTPEEAIQLKNAQEEAARGRQNEATESPVPAIREAQAEGTSGESPVPETRSSREAGDGLATPGGTRSSREAGDGLATPAEADDKGKPRNAAQGMNGATSVNGTAE